MQFRAIRNIRKSSCFSVFYAFVYPVVYWVLMTETHFKLI